MLKREAALDVSRKEFNTGDYEFTKPVGELEVRELPWVLPSGCPTATAVEQLERHWSPSSHGFRPGRLSPQTLMSCEEKSDPSHRQHVWLLELVCQVQLPQEGSLYCVSNLSQITPFWPSPGCTWNSSCKGAWEMQFYSFQSGNSGSGNGYQELIHIFNHLDINLSDYQV